MRSWLFRTIRCARHGKAFEVMPTQFEGEIWSFWSKLGFICALVFGVKEIHKYGALRVIIKEIFDFGIN